ncbi:hypothetical protein D3C72_1215960 [compost metagenome]
MLAPLRRPLGIGLHTWLLFERLAQHLVQAPHFFVIATLSRFDSALRQIVAQDVQRVDRMHAVAAAFGIAGLAVDSRQIVQRPAVKSGQFDEIITHYL